MGDVREDSSRVFATGARRNDSTGKGRYDLLPVEAIQALAQRFEYGASLHGDNNWRKGIPNASLFLNLHRLLNCQHLLIQHFIKALLK